MARIYNDMPGPIKVSASLLFIPTGTITIQPGQRSDSLSWNTATSISVWDENDHCICKFDFGLHAEIQGGNYAVIQPDSFLIYNASKEVISRGTRC